jgi:alpha-amylase
MVLNHSSKYLPLFESACKQALQGNLDDDARYFEIAHYDEDPGDAYTSIGKGYYYESNFSQYMPEWKLSADCTREYFLDVAQFWLKDHNVDGFRLDACLYYDSKDTNGEEFLKWYYNEVQKISPDVYMVGELWTGNAEIQQFYTSQIDSLFAFGFAGGDGGVVSAVRTQDASSLISSVQRYESKTKANNSNAINAYFLSNHDQIRSGNFFKISGLSGTKMGASAYMLLPGNSFIYYGEEIGMTQDSQADGDEYKREPMVWDSDNLPTIKVNDVTGSDESQVAYGGVEQQQEDEYSLLNFYKRIIKIKNQNPEIARGTITDTVDFDDDAVCAYYVEYNDSKVMIIHNFSDSDSKELDITEDILSNPTIRGDLVASNGADDDGNTVDEHITLNGSTLKMPPRSTVVLKSVE